MSDHALSLANRVEMLEQELKLKSQRVQSLEREIAELKDKIAAKNASRQSVTKRVPTTQVGFGASVTQTRMTPDLLASPRREGGSSAPPPRVVGLGDTKIYKSSTADDVPVERRSQYHAGKTKITVSLPAEYVGVAPRNAEPTETLQLNHIRGISSNRQGIHSSKGKVVYTAALLGVVLDLDSYQQQHFDKHTEDVLAIAVHEGLGVCATGQLDPKGRSKPNIKIWSIETQELLKQIVYHDRAIIALRFSEDGKYLFSMGGDNDQTTAVWEWATFVQQKGKPVFPLCTHPTLKFYNMSEGYDCFGFWMIPGSNANVVNYITMGRKHISMWNFDTRKKELINSKLILASYKSTTSKVPAYYSSAASVEDYYYVHTEPGDVYKMKDNVTVASLGLFESGSGVCIRSPEGLAVFGVGKTGPRAVFWQTSELIGEQFPAPAVSFELKEPSPVDFVPIGGAFHNGNFLVQLKNRQVWSFNIESQTANVVIDCHSGDSMALATSPLGNYIATVSADKTLRLWNDSVKTLAAERRFDLMSGGTAVAFSPAGDMIAVGLDNGLVNIIKDGAFAKIAKIGGEGISSLAFSPDGKLLAAGCLDMAAYILTVPNLEIKARLKWNTSSVMHVQWSADGTVLQTDSRDYQILFWNVAEAKRIERQIEIMDTKWFKWQCKLGWPVQGIWDGSDEGYDINNVDVNPSNTLIAVADDLGYVRLYQYPALALGMKHKASIGHSSHVTDVRFNADGTKVYSTGGSDTTLLEWDVIA